MKRVYIAGPYTKGDVAENVRIAVRIGSYIADQNHIPFIPHLTHFWHLLAPRPYEFWISYDLLWLDKCDCLVRIEGESKGADREVQYALASAKPVLKISGMDAESLNQLDKFLIEIET